MTKKKKKVSYILAYEMNSLVHEYTLVIFLGEVKNKVIMVTLMLNVEIYEGLFVVILTN